ncbi:MAG: transposase [Clostridiaceae bacterium]|nr:transposase [Clostridiaceae bacterium]
MKTAKEKAVKKGKSALTYYYLHKFDKEYDRIMALADTQCPFAENPPHKKRGRKKKGSERSLIERLMQLKASIGLFVRDFAIPFDNNQAERDIRNVKTKVKVSGCFRTQQKVWTMLSKLL